MELEDRCIEVHSAYVWDHRHMRKVLDFAAAHQMTAVVLHRNDIVDLVVYPSRYFGASAPSYSSNLERYRDTYEAVFTSPTRADRPCRARTYLNRLIDEANQRGLQVFLENKEIFFHDTIPERNPQVVKQGHLCASDPFWTKFIRVKYEELVIELPGLAGVIVSPGTAEGRLSLISNACTCAGCHDISPERWYSDVLLAMHKPLHDADMRLVVRDFSFDANAHSAMIDAVVNLPDDITVALKNTPHDYYPTFPHNPRIGAVGKHRQWIEIDCMGQFFGWGIAPAIMIDDISSRITYGVAHGVSGLMLRTDWEGLEGHTAFDTPNRINVCAGAALSREIDTPPEQIFEHWLDEMGFYRAEASSADRRDAASWCVSILGRSWPIIEGALFVRSCVFSESSCVPVSMADAVWVGEQKDGLADWDPSARDALVPSEENLATIVKHSDTALADAKALDESITAGHRAITPRALEEFASAWSMLISYVEQFRTAVQAVFFTRYLVKCYEHSHSADGHLRASWQSSIEDLERIAVKLEEFGRASSLGYPVYMLLDPERLRTLRSSLLIEASH